MKYSIHRTIKQLATGIVPGKRRKNRRPKPENKNNNRNENNRR